MASYEFVGTVKVVGEVQEFKNNFTKRELVVTSEEDRFPQDVAFEFTKERGDLLNGVNEADRVKVTFDLQGREFNGRYFVSLRAWKIEKMDGEGASESAAPVAPAAAVPPKAEMPKDIAVDDEDDLPF